MSIAAAGRAQLRGSRIASSSQAANSSKATLVSSVRRSSRRSDSDADGSTGASALRSSCSMSKLRASAICRRQFFFELLDRAVDQDLGRTLGAAERARDFAVVHVECEAHDQRGLPVLREGGDAGEHVTQFLPALDELTRLVLLGDGAGVVDVGLRAARAVAEVVGREVVDDADEPWPEWAAVRLAQRALEVAIGLQERLLGEVLGVVVGGDAGVGVAVDVAQVRAVEVAELGVQLRLVGRRHRASLTTLRPPSVPARVLARPLVLPRATAIAAPRMA